MTHRETTPEALIDADLRREIARTISQHTPKPFIIDRCTEVGGGSISRALVVAAGNGERWFVKVGRSDALAMFAAEADGLDGLGGRDGFCGAKAPLRVPRVAGYGVSGEHAYLVIEYIELLPLHQDAATAGRALAALHRCCGERYGWRSDNYIGSTPQNNDEGDDWPGFFARQRLAPQLELARCQAPPLAESGERLLAVLPALFAGHRPLPSLIHGDLWHGNAALDATGRLVLYDPAVHYADRECDLAIAALFGGFPAAFFAAYQETWPLAAGHAERRPLYQLYHLLNHYNLFGGGYREQAAAMITGLLASSRG